MQHCFVLSRKSLAISGVRGHRNCKSQKSLRFRCAKPHHVHATIDPELETIFAFRYPKDPAVLEILRDSNFAITISWFYRHFSSRRRVHSVVHRGRVVKHYGVVIHRKNPAAQKHKSAKIPFCQKPALTNRFAIKIEFRFFIDPTVIRTNRGQPRHSQFYPQSNLFAEC